MYNYKELQIRHRSREFVKDIYQLTEVFPDTEGFELETRSILANDLQVKLEEIQKMIFGFEKRLKYQKIEQES